MFLGGLPGALVRVVVVEWRVGVRQARVGVCLPMTDVTPRLKADPVVCATDGCGIASCTAVGQPTKNGHPRGCSNKCPQCRGRRNKAKGRKRQAAAVRAVGIPRSSLSPGHEEFLAGAVRVEVKAGAQAGPVWTRFVSAESQSEAARPFGDNRPFVFLAMPDGTSDGLIVFRLSQLDATVMALAEQRGLVA